MLQKKLGLSNRLDILVNDTWTEEDGVFISDKRKEDGKKAKETYNNDLFIAKQFAKARKEPIYMIPERSKGSNPDCIFNGEYLEMKFVHGNRRAVQSKTMEGLNQANNVYSYIEQNLTEKECFNSIRGCLLDKVKHSYVVS